MKNVVFIGFLFLFIFSGCNSSTKSNLLKKTEKTDIHDSIQVEIDRLILAVSNKDIDVYMDQMPDDFIIYDEKGEIITREKQKEYALRDWSIIKKTLNNEMKIDSIDFISSDSIFVFTSQRWERLMFQRDGITLDTVLTTQLHKELWKKKNNAWKGYDVVELGGEIFINGQKYDPE